MMNIIINDLEMNTELDQTALSSVIGGWKRYGAWKRTGSYSSFRKGATHMSNYWTRKGRLFKRSGHQHATRRITIKYVRRVNEYVFA